MNPQDLINKPCTNYLNERGTIVAAAPLNKWEALMNYDDSGWMNQDTIDDLGFEDEDEAMLVAFKPDDSSHPIDVYVFGGDGVTLID